MEGAIIQNTGFLQVGQVDSNHLIIQQTALDLELSARGLGHVYQVRFYDNEGFIETQLINHEAWGNNPANKEKSKDIPS